MIVVLVPLSSSSSAAFFLRSLSFRCPPLFLHPNPLPTCLETRRVRLQFSVSRCVLKFLCSLLVSRRRLRVVSSRDRVLFSDLENENRLCANDCALGGICSIGRNRTSRNRARWLIRCRCTLLVLRAAVLVVVIIFFCRGFLPKEVRALPTERKSEENFDCVGAL